MLVWIAAGEFTMGLTGEQITNLLTQCSDCKESFFKPSKPVHQVYLDAYWIYQTEVTNSQYARCEQAGACSPPAQSNSSAHASYYSNGRFANYPVIFVDWSAADRYCQWAGGRLPSEAQWEKAARGTDARLYPWGNSFPNQKYANVGKNVGDTTQVGTYPGGASPYGVLDMAGNVYEWTQDWYAADYYSSSPAQNPQGPGGPTGDPARRVIRGGNWFWNGAYATVAYHDYWEPFQTSNDVGFRCVVMP
jgi:formylglycine-generating enzyme required for sulfatase activity